MSKSCGCGGHINGALQSNMFDSVLSLGGSIVAGTVGYKLAEIAGQHVDFMKTDKMVSGLVKIGAALGIGLLVPEISENQYGVSLLTGMGASGGQDLLEKAGIKGIGFVNHNRFINPNIAETGRNMSGQEEAVKVHYH